MCAGAGTSVSLQPFRKISQKNRPHLDCHPFVYGLGFLGVIRSSFLELVTSLLGWTCWRHCNVDVEDELLPELSDKPGTTRSTKLSVLQMIAFTFLVRGF